MELSSGSVVGTCGARRRFGRRAVAFTIVAVILVSLLVLTIAVERGLMLTEQMQVVRTRVITMNDFVKDVERDLRRGLYITGFRSVLSVQEFVTTNATYVDDIDFRLREGMVNGTIYGSSAHLLVNSTLEWWLSRIRLQGALIGIDVNITFGNVTVQHDSPWTVIAQMDAWLNMSDTKGMARWDRPMHIVAIIPITDMEDPLYTLNSGGTIINQIRISNYSANYTDFDSAEFLSHVRSGAYIPNLMAPDFLMRLEGNMSSSPYGIESIVDLGRLGLAMSSRSSVDYLYFDVSTPSECQVFETAGIPELDWLHLDPAHRAFYNVSCAP